MKTIFFNLNPPEGSYGGGAFFVKNLSRFLLENGYKVTYEFEKNLDIIFMIDPRRGPYKKYGLQEIYNYKKYFPNTKIIYRVNECDIKREKSINIEPILLEAMKIANKVVFISKWLKDYFINKYNLKLKSVNTILNGCNSEHFFPKKNIVKQINNNNKIKLVTHHWSNNYLKGFYIYNKIDKLLENNSDIEFTFIGNYNKDFIPKNIKLISPKSGKELGNILQEQDIYITATQNEPCGMHHIEGMSSGLPIIYRKNGGAIKEACNKCGIEFTEIDDMLEAIQKIKKNYETYKSNINYEYLSSERCSKEYYEIIMDLLK